MIEELIKKMFTPILKVGLISSEAVLTDAGSHYVALPKNLVTVSHPDLEASMLIKLLRDLLPIIVMTHISDCR